MNLGTSHRTPRRKMRKTPIRTPDAAFFTRPAEDSESDSSLSSSLEYSPPRVTYTSSLLDGDGGENDVAVNNTNSIHKVRGNSNSNSGNNINRRFKKTGPSRSKVNTRAQRRSKSKQNANRNGAPSTVYVIDASKLHSGVKGSEPDSRMRAASWLNPLDEDRSDQPSYGVCTSSTSSLSSSSSSSSSTAAAASPPRASVADTQNATIDSNTNNDNDNSINAWHQQARISYKSVSPLGSNEALNQAAECCVRSSAGNIAMGADTRLVRNGIIHYPPTQEKNERSKSTPPSHNNNHSSTDDHYQPFMSDFMKFMGCSNNAPTQPQSDATSQVFMKHWNSVGDGMKRKMDIPCATKFSRVPGADSDVSMATTTFSITDPPRSTQQTETAKKQDFSDAFAKGELLGYIMEYFQSPNDDAARELRDVAQANGISVSTLESFHVTLGPNEVAPQLDRAFLRRRRFHHRRRQESTAQSQQELQHFFCGGAQASLPSGLGHSARIISTITTSTMTVSVAETR